MKKNEIVEQLKTLIEDQTEKKIKDENENLDIDSFTMMLVITFADQKLNVKLDMETLDFDQFKSLEIMKAGKLIDKYFSILKKNYKKGIAIGIITARDDQDMIYEWLRYHVGFHIDKHLIWAVNDPVHGLTGNIQERKKSAMRYFIERGYTDITFFDDDKHNIKLIKQLDKEIDTVKITTHLAKK